MSVTLSIADYFVIAMTMIVSTGIGIYYWLTGNQEKTTEEYFVADRSMKVTPVAIGLMASYLSAISLLGISSEIYVFGTQYAVINISYGLATLFVVYFYMPVFFKLGATSAFEYLQKRYGSATKFVTSSAFLLQLILYTGVVLYAPALALEATTNLSTTASVIGIGLVCTLYSTIGGIKAVLITDIFQSLLMIIAVVLVIVTGAISAGGIDRIWKIAEKGGRIEFDKFTLDPTTRYSWWDLTIGGFFTYVSLYGVNQVQVQRLLTIKNLESARRAIWLSWPMASIMSLTTSFAGLVIYAKYHDCDPLTSKKISSNDQLMPFYVMDTLSKYPGVPGIFVAGIFSAGLSTISATMNSLAAVVLEDYVRPACRLMNKEITARQELFISRALTVIVGFICLGVAFLASSLGGLLQAALTIFGILGGPMLGLFTLGMTSESSNQRGAITGLFISLACCLWIAFGQPKPSPPQLPVSIKECSFNQSIQDDFTNRTIDNNYYFYPYRITHMWYCPLGFFISFSTGWIVSWIVRLIFDEQQQQDSLDPDLFTPFVANRIRERRRKRISRHSIHTDTTL